MRTVSQQRTQVYFPADLYWAVKDRAKLQDISMAEVIRRAVQREVMHDQKLAKTLSNEVWKKFFQASGVGNSGLGDLAVDHDRYLAPDEQPRMGRRAGRA